MEEDKSLEGFAQNSVPLLGQEFSGQQASTNKRSCRVYSGDAPGKECLISPDFML